MTVSIAEMMAMPPGAPLGASDWLVVDQTMIDRFADVTGDRQFIHVDQERARATPLGGTVAHGFLTLALLPLLAERIPLPQPEARLALNYGLNRVRFLAPVRSGSRIRAHFALAGFSEKRPGRYQQVLDATVEAEHRDAPVMAAQWLFQIFT